MTRRRLRKIAHDAEHLRLLLAWRHAPPGLKAKRKKAVDAHITARLKEEAQHAAA